MNILIFFRLLTKNMMWKK